VPRKDVEQLEAELARVRVLASGIAPEILDAVLEHSAQGIIVAATGGRITLHNRAAAALWPAAIAEPSMNAPLMRCLDTRAAVPPVEVTIERDGKRALLLETCAPMAGGRAVAMIADITELHARTTSARLATERLTRLQAITAALSEARFPADVARVAAKEMARALGARQGALALAEAGDLVMVDHSGLGAASARQYARFPVDTDVPLARAYRSGLAVYVRSREELDAQFPVRALEPSLAVACVPLIINGLKIGAVGFGFAEPRPFDTAERALVEDLARNAGLALERARLYESSRQAQRRFELLARASRRFAENEPEHEALVEAIVAEVAAGLQAGALLALGDAQETIATVTDGDPSPTFGDRERDVMRTGKSSITRAAICAPLRARGRAIGTLTAQRDQPFTPDDLLLLEELATQAALALDNAAQLRT
jgi:GAF domain-containing protein